MPWPKKNNGNGTGDGGSKGVRHGTGTARQTPRRTIAARAKSTIGGSTIGGGKRRVG